MPCFFFFQAEGGIRDGAVTGVQPCALPISRQRDSEGAQNERHPERGGPAHEERGDGVAQVGAQHVERAVREIQDAEHAEDEREARGDEEKKHRLGEPVQALHHDEGGIAEDAKVKHGARSGLRRRPWSYFWPRRALTSSKVRMVFSPPMYWRSPMIRKGYSGAFLSRPKYCPLLDWWSYARMVKGPWTVSTVSPSSASTTFSVSVLLALRIASARK